MIINECPKCGCNDIEKIRSFMQWGKKWERVRCNHCGKTFSEASPEVPVEAVEYIRVRCPYCDSVETRVYKTLKPVRYHKCDSCQKAFKSVESCESVATPPNK